MFSFLEGKKRAAIAQLWRPGPNLFFILGFIIILVAVVTAAGKSLEREGRMPDGQVGVYGSPVFDPFDLAGLEARAAIVTNASSGEALFEKNADFGVPLASITKVMTALAAHDKLETGASVFITDADISTQGESGLFAGEQWAFDTLSDFMLVGSSNDAAEAIARAAAGRGANAVSRPFAKLMNQKAAALGLHEAFFLNPSGLDETRKLAGAYGSARTVARLFEKILRDQPSILKATRQSALAAVSRSGVTHGVKNTNRLVNSIPSLEASKTGFTDLAGGNLAVAYAAENGQTIVIAVLGSTETGRFRDVAALHAASRSFSKRNTDITSAAVCTPVQKTFTNRAAGV